MSGEKINFVPEKISISSLPKDPEEPEWGATEETVYSTMISHDKEGRSPKKIWKEKKKDLSKEELDEFHKDFLDKLANWGHMSAFYQANVGLLYEVPRHATMFFCSFDHPKYLQQSQRYTEARNFIEPNKNLREVIPKQKDLYDRMIGDDVKKEDARYILPLSTAATHLHQNTNFAGLANIYRVLESDYSKVPKLIKDIFYRGVDGLNSKEAGLFRIDLMDKYNSHKKNYPVANMFSESNKWVNEVIPKDENVIRFSRKIDEELISESKKLNDQAASFLNLTNDKNEVIGFGTNLSLSAWHQFMRNDTVKQSIESIYDAADRGEIVVPKTVEDSKYEEEFVGLAKETLEFYDRAKRSFGEVEAVTTLPHALSLGLAFELDGYNTIGGFMKDRTSEAAQWEIRNIAKDAKYIMEEENKLFSEYVG